MDNSEAVKIVNAIKPVVKEWSKEWEHSCLRVKQMTVVTAPSDGVIGVKEGFGNEIIVPCSMMLSNAQVGDVVYCCWVANNQSTMVAMWDGSMTRTQVRQPAFSIKKIWENASPTSSFSAKTVTPTVAGESFANYNAFVLTFYSSKNVLVASNTYCFTKSVQHCMTITNASASSAWYSRDYKITDSGCQFFTGYKGGSSSGNTGVVIPLYIYGIEGVTIS